MRQRISKSLLLLCAIILQPLTTTASPFPTQFVNLILRDRACENPCGYYGQLCCSSSETCGTDSNGQAVCSSNVEQRNDNGQWEYWTTTYVQTDYVTVTSTGSSWVPAPTSDDGQCKASLGEVQCGWTCCSASQTCDEGECVEAGNSPIETPPSPTPPLRPTDTTGATITPTATQTLPFIPPVGTDGSSTDPMPSEDNDGGGLSGGAIAGIVIGSLAGAALLLLLCCCLCVGSCIDRARTILGLNGGNRTSSYTGSSSRSSRHGGGGGGRTWFGAGPARPGRNKKKKSGLFGLGWMAALGLAIAVFLGLKRRNDRSEKTSTYYGSSEYTYSSYSYSGSSSSSSSSSGPRRGGRR